uniref:Zinc-finger domain-containing protein n=1 Tax=Cucumis sativus TaxID=3659 RepID=A0A0A0LLU9_CUCSA
MTCRQKTLGHHTHCSKCKLGQGQFCGDCLYARYGENVMEVNLNPNWVCPVHNLGFKSVAHYLIQTRCNQTNQKGSSSKHVDAGDSSQALANDPQHHDYSLSSGNSLDIEGTME